jgi:hypothetical protein
MFPSEIMLFPHSVEPLPKVEHSYEGFVDRYDAIKITKNNSFHKTLLNDFLGNIIHK